ncbi:hypothetical protein ACQPZX_38590 [Actinoplanes sp. CA-142083]|uniref:hypothetical protein n=1 Tax=Actinoplanes sp. CA-142083 TaxID=3239903 RepID=UPI003D93DD3F
MDVTTGVQVTIRFQANPAAEPDENDVRAIVFAAFPKLMGYGAGIEHVDGRTWLVSVPTEKWEEIQDQGYFEFGTELDAHRWAKLIIEA